MGGGVGDSGEVRELGEGEIKKIGKSNIILLQLLFMLLTFLTVPSNTNGERFKTKKASRRKN
jgi:hypothetical protein